MSHSAHPASLDRVRLGAVRAFIAMSWAIMYLADAVAAAIVELLISLTARAAVPLGARHHHSELGQLPMSMKFSVAVGVCW